MAVSQKVKLGLLQSWADADPVSNLKRTLKLAHEAADRGAQIISTQELFRSQYFCQSEDPAHFPVALARPPFASWQRSGAWWSWPRSSSAARRAFTTIRRR